MVNLSLLIIIIGLCDDLRHRMTECIECEVATYTHMYMVCIYVHGIMCNVVKAVLKPMTIRSTQAQHVLGSTGMICELA